MMDRNAEIKKKVKDINRKKKIKRDRQTDRQREVKKKKKSDGQKCCRVCLQTVPVRQPVRPSSS